MTNNVPHRRAFLMCSSKGLGLGSAVALARKNFDLTLTGRNDEALEAAKNLCLQVNPRIQVFTFKADLTSPAETEGLITRAVKAMGGLDAVLLNSPGPAPGRLFEFSALDWQQCYESLLLSPMQIFKEALPYLKESDSGRIIGISSISSLKPISNLALSNVLRPAVEAWLRNLALEVSEFRITANVLRPGRVLSDRIHQLVDKLANQSGRNFNQELEAFAADIPMKRIGNIEEFGEVVAFLSSPESQYVTGQIIGVDGGLSLI